MSEEQPLVVPRNPAQIPASQFRLSRNLKVRGDAIYIIFGGIIGAVFLFFVLMDISAILAVGVCWIPLVFAVWFYFRFVREKPKYYFDYWLNSLFGTALRFESRLKARKKLSAIRMDTLSKPMCPRMHFSFTAN